jgi:hypothetical protein
MVAGASLAVWAASAQADTYTLTNNTSVEAYKNTSPNAIFQSSPYGSYWGPDVSSGPNDYYHTSGATFTWTGNVLDIQFTTGFAGVDSRYQSQYGVTIYAADIFLKAGGGSALPGPNGFNYAIALGFDTPEGGLSAGLYSVSSLETSQDIWSSGRSHFTYGGLFAPNSSCTASGCSNSELSPTVLTGGSLVGGLGAVTTTVNYTPGSGGALGTMDVKLTANNQNGLNALATVFGPGFDVFWGTGDCSNAPIWGDIPDFGPSVPEPASLALFASALLGWTVLRRRKQHTLSA